MLRWRWAKKTFNLNDVGSGINQVDHPCDKSELCVHARSSSTARRAECLSSSHQLSQQTLPSRTFSCPVAARFFVSHLRMCVCVCGPFFPGCPGAQPDTDASAKNVNKTHDSSPPEFPTHQLTNTYRICWYALGLEKRASVYLYHYTLQTMALRAISLNYLRHSNTLSSLFNSVT